jgi:hypothetical protein
MDDAGVADNDNTVSIIYQGAPVTIPPRML